MTDHDEHGSGSEVSQIGAMTLMCMRREASELLDDAYARWQAFTANRPPGSAPPDEPSAVYRAFYWLVRYSNLIVYDSDDAHIAPQKGGDDGTAN